MTGTPKEGKTGADQKRSTLHFICAGERKEREAKDWEEMRKHSVMDAASVSLCSFSSPQSATLVRTVTAAPLVILISSDMNTFEDTQA